MCCQNPAIARLSISGLFLLGGGGVGETLPCRGGREHAPQNLQLIQTKCEESLFQYLF